MGIIVHNTFVCKPGNASKMAKLFKEAMADDKNLLGVLTDVTGQFNRVVMVSRYESLTAYEEDYKSMQNPTEEMKKAFEKMKGYTEMYLTGHREIFMEW